MSLTNKALFIIERNLANDLSLTGIAKDCNVSRFHLAHAFGETTGLTVMDYVRARRLSEAARAMASGASHIIEVALEAGYSSHEAFSRAFKAQFNTTPEEVRKSNSVATLSLMDARPHRESKPAKLLDPRAESVGELLFVGLEGIIAYGESHKIAHQWQRFMSEPYHEIAYKAATIPVGINLQGDEGEMRYICAAEVTRFGEIPKGLTKVILPPQTYCVFEHAGHITTLDDTYAAIWNDWFPARGKTPAEAPGFQRHNPAFDPRTGNGGVTIWLPVMT